MGEIYVTGHVNPDTDSIASAVGYAELRSRLDPGGRYVPVRLGELNAQTAWVLERSGADEPPLLTHILLRVRDVMQREFSIADQEEAVRKVGLTMAREDSDLLPVVDADGALAGVVTERGLARRYIRESRETSSLVDAPTSVREICEELEGELLAGGDLKVAGRVWVLAMDAASDTGIEPGDVVVVGDRVDAQRKAIELGAALVVMSNGTPPAEDVLELARERGVAMIVSPLDSYVSGRMITLSAPCRAVMDREPLTVRPDDLVVDVSEQVKDIHYRAAIAVDSSRRPVGLVTRSDLVNPQPRRVILVDHAEQAQSVAGIETAEIVEILDHHHIGSIETKVPVRATFDPVGSTATLVIERFRAAGMEPARPTAILMLGAILSDTVILNSPTATDRDRAAVDYLERALDIDATEFGRQMFEDTSDVSKVAADKIVTRDAKRYDVGAGETICIAQIETVGKGVLARKDELLEEMERIRRGEGHRLFALMVTDIMAKGTTLLVAGDKATVQRALSTPSEDGVIELPGVMSRKKQLAPRLLSAF